LLSYLFVTLFQEPIVKPAAEAELLGRLQLQLDSHANLLLVHSSRLDCVESRLDVTGARALEDRDEQLNRACENRIVVHGLPRLSGDNRQELKSAAYTKLSQALAETFPALVGKYTLISAAYFDSDFPVYEGTLASISEASELRRVFGKRSFNLRKASGLRILNSVTPGTRVRLSILKSMMSAYKKLHPAGTFTLLGYLSRPVVRFRAEASGPLRTCGFVDAVLALPPTELKLQDPDFQHAYRAAGRRFIGKLASYFLVLSDSSSLASVVVTQSRKRTNDGTPEGASSARRRVVPDSDEVTALQVNLELCLSIYYRS